VLADLRREYGVDLLDFYRGRLSFWELCSFLSGLPAECATARRMRGESAEGDGWGTQEILLGGLLDATRSAWSEKPVDSCLPKVLFDEVQPEPKSDLQPVSELAGLFGSDQAFVDKHGK
jgi:hypothetical protein